MDDFQYHYKKILALLGDEELAAQFPDLQMLYSFSQHRKEWGRLIKDIGLIGTISSMRNFFPCVQYIHAMPLSKHFFHPIYSENEIEQKIGLILDWLEKPTNKTKEGLAITIRWFEDIHLGYEPIQASENFIDFLIIAITTQGKFQNCILGALETLKKLGFPEHIIQSEFKAELKEYVRNKFA